MHLLGLTCPTPDTKLATWSVKDLIRVPQVYLDSTFPQNPISCFPLGAFLLKPQVGDREGNYCLLTRVQPGVGGSDTLC